MDETKYLEALHAAISRTDEPDELERLRAEVARLEANAVRRARAVPNSETRANPAP